MTLLLQYWHSNDIPPDVAEAIQTFQDKNPDLEHLLFNEDRAAEFIEKHFTRRECDAFAACAVPAMQADYFRYCALFMLGGVYADADLRCIASVAPLLPEVQSIRLYRDPVLLPTINTAFMIVRAPRHRFWRLVLDKATRNIEERSVNSVWHCVGPRLINDLYKQQTEANPDSLPDGVEIRPGAELGPYVVNTHMAYKDQSLDWRRWEGSIFR